MIGRRTFLERVGLGAGAAMLGPIAEGLVSQALGQTKVRKRAVFMMIASGFPSDYGKDIDAFCPRELRSDHPDYGWPGVSPTKDFTWPGALKGMEAYRARSLLIDGMSNVLTVKSQHSCGFGALSCMDTEDSAEGGGAPKGPTIDQVVAGVIGGGTRFKSVLLGVTANGAAETFTSAFAAGPHQALPHMLEAKLIFKTLFGSAMADATGIDKGQVRARLVMDALRGDLKRLQAAFAGEEKRKLDQYLSVIDDFDQRLSAGGPLTCTPVAPALAAVQPGLAATDDIMKHPDNFRPPAEDRTRMVFDMAKMALVCGITNVVGIAIGSGFTHNTFPWYAGDVYTKSAFIDPMYGYVDDNGHGPNPQTMAYLHGWHSGLLKGVADALSGIKEGDKTAFDNAAIVHCGENGEAHHSDHVRWPVAIYGDAGGALKADGRYLRFAKKGGSGARSLADVYATIGAAFGVANPDDFAKGGPEARQGVVHEMLA